MPDPIIPEQTQNPAPAAVPATAPALWYGDGLDAETVGHIQNRGWHDKDPKVVALEAIKAHRSAEAMLGVPADRVVKLPKDAADEAGWKDVWAKLGKPGDGKYDLTSVKVGDAPLPQADADWIAAQANELNLSQEAAVRLAQSVIKRQGDTAAASLAETTAKQQQEAGKLAANWGQNAEANLFVAKQTAAKLGVTPEAVAALEGQIGYSAVMEMFRAIGAKTGEAEFVSNGSNFNGGVMTREGATARKAELMADTGWTSRYMAGDAAAGREMLALNTIIVGDDTNSSRR